jgi:hypothetical protein
VELQHLNVKLLLKDPEQIDLDPLIAVFHGWIENQVFNELLLDVADYRHVHHGPGIVLIAHEADYSIDNTDGRLGLRYNRKARLGGGNQDRLGQALRAALLACQRLEADERLGRKLRFNGQDVEFFINDRLIAPNCQERRDALDREFRSFFGKLFGDTGFSLRYESDARRLLGGAIHSQRPFSVQELIERLDEGGLPGAGGKLPHT